MIASSVIDNVEIYFSVTIIYFFRQNTMNSFLVIGFVLYDSISIEVVCGWLSKSKKTAMNGIAIFLARKTTGRREYGES